MAGTINMIKGAHTGHQEQRYRIVGSVFSGRQILSGGQEALRHLLFQFCHRAQ